MCTVQPPQQTPIAFSDQPHSAAHAAHQTTCESRCAVRDACLGSLPPASAQELGTLRTGTARLWGLTCLCGRAIGIDVKAGRLENVRKLSERSHVYA